MTVSNSLAAVLTPFVPPVPASASTAPGTPPQTPKEEVGTHLRSMRNMGLTSLRQTVLHRVNSHFSTALNVNDDSGSDKAKGAAITVAGAAMQGIGGRIASSGGFGAKILGGAMVWGGRATEEYGKDKYGSAGNGTNSTGNYNAYDPNNWGGRA